MILKDLSDASLYTLFRPELRATQSGSFARVPYKDKYQIHWLAGAMWLRDDRRKVTVWDLGKYYQQPFCTVDSDGKLTGALVDWKVRPDVQQQIAAMKKRRSAFTWRDMKQIRKYCLQECEALSELAAENERAHIDADLKPRSWFGPGSTASVLLNRHSIKERRGIVAPSMVEPVACAFFGGRAEISTNGYVKGPIYGYDISSAYPHHASILPCLEHGRWEKVTQERAIKRKGGAGALVHGHVHHAVGDWAPLPVRLKNGTIVFPRSGASGWWWRDEWLAARSGWKGLSFDHAFVLHQECECVPFNFLPQMFERRRSVGKETCEGKILKLGLNSVYGKLAQTIGQAQYASRIWAGMITSGTRAQVLRLMIKHKQLDSILMIATDGLFSTELHDVDPKIVLGGWERSEHESITLVRPGIYWTGEGKLRARGLGRDSLDFAKQILAGALEAQASGVRFIHESGRRPQEIVLPPRVAFGGAKVCVYGFDLDTLTRSANYGQWHPMPTHVSLAPGPKRRADWSTPALYSVESAPYGTLKTRQTGELFEILELIRDLMQH